MKNHRIAWVLAALVMLVALMWPALWNGFPLVFYDTGGYLVRPFEGTLGLSRAALYGAFLAAAIPLNFWPNIVLQAAVIVWLIVLTLRVHGHGGRPWLAAGLITALAIFTGLPWYVAQLMPDIFLPAAVLSLGLLAFHWPAVRRWEVVALGAIIAVAIAVHLSFLALALGLLAALVIIRLLASRLNLAQPRLLTPAIAVAVGIGLGPLANGLIVGQFAFAPGGVHFIFARLLDDGIIRRYLSDRCPDPSIRLCAYRDVLPSSGNDWLWDNNSPFYREYGGHLGFAAEASRINRESLARYPGAAIASALKYSAWQFVRVRSGDGMASDAWHTIWAIETYAPRTLAAFRASRQQQDTLKADTLTVMHGPVGLAATLVLPIVVMLGLHRRVSSFAATLALFVLLALLGSAVVTGTLSIPADRYQSRLVWLAPLAILMAVPSARRHERLAPANRQVATAAPTAVAPPT